MRPAWNALIGRLLLVTAFLWAAWLDPWSLSERDPASLPGSAQMAARQAQAVIVGMAFLQFIVVRALASGAWMRQRRAVSLLTGAGALLYAVGYALAATAQPAVWLILVGALLNFIGFAFLLLRAGGGVWRIVLAVICLGMALDTVMGLFTVNPHLFLPAYLGPADGVRLRMLRLARAAAIALPAVALLYESLAARAANDRLVRTGRVLLWCGVATMSATLAVAAFTDGRVKYLLIVPGPTTFAGTCAGVVLAWRYAGRLETWGWLLVAASMGFGLLMGLYAFDGPLPAPEFLGSYSDFARRLSRLAHSYCIVLGLLSVFVARQTQQETRRWGVPLLIGGTVVTLGVQAAVVAEWLPVGALAVGPVLLAPAIVLCLGLRDRTAARGAVG
jgi:hypothetical protein